MLLLLLNVERGGIEVLMLHEDVEGDKLVLLTMMKLLLMMLLLLLLLMKKKPFVRDISERLSE